jgi:hypothetical protein
MTDRLGVSRREYTEKKFALLFFGGDYARMEWERCMFGLGCWRALTGWVVEKESVLIG